MNAPASAQQHIANENRQDNRQVRIQRFATRGAGNIITVDDCC
jgi:hypothetical protein